MGNNFSFIADHYNFWPVYETIRKYYPLGIERQEQGIYFQFAGILELERLIEENVHIQSNYQKRWKKKLDDLSSITGKRIIDTTYGQEPSFCAYIELEHSRIKDYVIEKRLYFTVSIIGSFYTVFETDQTVLTVKEVKTINGNSINNFFYKGVIKSTISPYEENKRIFQSLRTFIESEFQQYRYIPYLIYSSKLNGLEVRYSENSLNRVYHALFNQQFDFNSAITGDQFSYGFDQWKN